MDHGILQAGGIDVPLYPTMTPEDYVYILNHSESKFCFVSNQELFDKVASIQDQVPSLQKVYMVEEAAPRHGARSSTAAVRPSRKSWTAPGRRRPRPARHHHLHLRHHRPAERRDARPQQHHPEHPQLHPPLPDFDLSQEYRVLSFLPVCHIFERMLHYLYMYCGVKIHFGGSLETVKDDMIETKPHMFTAVPRLLEKFYDGIVAKGQAAGGVKAAIFNWAVGLALQWQPDGQNGAFYEWKLGIARKLVFDKVKEALGLTQIMAVACGSAALAPRLARFFNGAGIPVWEGALTETSPVVSVSTTKEPGMLGSARWARSSPTPRSTSPRTA